MNFMLGATERSNVRSIFKIYYFCLIIKYEWIYFVIATKI